MPPDCAKLLVVDDDLCIRHLISRFFSQHNYEVKSAEDGKSARLMFDKFNPDMVILDVNLPDANGYNLCEEMRSCSDVYVVMLTSRTDEADIIQGFTQGADDYITKPFSLAELSVRVGAILKRQRHVTAPPQKCLVFDNLVIDPVRREVKLNNQMVSLTALEFNLLRFLASYPGQVWRRSELLQEVWEYDYVDSDRLIDVHIGQIRKKIKTAGSDSSLIQTVRGVGYKFEAASNIMSLGNGCVTANS
ncbi:response regulator transcription factor [Microseira sp. BLCC-F43]|jgi:DNA-binding response OmpR family regulator|uniref:response regulator transcription factor n=1 Tax=Microseira sp. BLCC-F43 TaxID=3153602 RepID=UPI0035B81444